MKSSDIIVLIAAIITLITALVPVGKWAWRTYGVRHFDAKKAHYNRLIEDAEWQEDRLVKLDTLRKQLLYAKMYEQLPDRFKLSAMIAQLDRKDAQWASRVDDIDTLIQECERNQEECQQNAEQCREWAEDVARKVLFW
jgi:Tfp pilus assembly protein PilO